MFEIATWERVIGTYADIKGADQTAHLRNLISAFAARLQV